MMVFGTPATGRDRSASGATRDRREGVLREFLINAQGEDVVAGIRTPQPIRELGR
jgi:pyruvate,orthophosphate dikinase